MNDTPRETAPPRIDRRRALAAMAAASAWPLVSGCGAANDAGTEAGGDQAAQEAASSVVVYVALDREFSEPILDAFTKKTGIKVLPKYDVESTKTVGLTNLLIAEAARPRCDVFWNNETLNTVRLREKKMLQGVELGNGKAYPEAFRDQWQHWHGFAARARVLLVNTEAVAEADRPKSIEELTDTKWKGKLAIAKPLFGTTATHATCLFAAWGPEKAKAFFSGLKANDVKVLSGNLQVAQAVGNGEVPLGLTDTDDALGQIAAGKPVAIVYLDREPDQLGTLFIPNTVAVIRNPPNLMGAMSLADYLLSPEVEATLARGPSGQIPLNPEVEETTAVETPKTVHPMAVDWKEAAGLWDEAAKFLTAEFGG